MKPDEILKALAGIVTAIAEFFKTSEARYKIKLDRNTRKALGYGVDMVDRIRELGVDDKELNKAIKRFLKYVAKN